MDLSFTWEQLNTEELRRLEPGTYNLTVDCNGAPDDYFQGSYSRQNGYYTLSPFAFALSRAKPGVYFNLTFNIPDYIYDIKYCFYHDRRNNIYRKAAEFIKSIKVTSAKNVTSLMYAFSGGFKTDTGSEKYEIDLSAFINAEDCQYLFFDTNAISKITGLSSLTNVTKITNMFNSCSGLTSIDKPVFPNITDANNMFQRCSSLISVDCSGLTNVEKLNGMFQGCSNLTNITGLEVLFKKATTATSFFSGCSSLTSIDTKIFKNITNTSSMFAGCTGLTSIDTKPFERTTDTSYMFQGCTGLTSIDTKPFERTINTSSMFAGCTGLTSIDAKPLANTINTSYMFQGCSNLTLVDCSGLLFTTNANRMFAGCSSLINIDLTFFGNEATNTGFIFDGCTGLKNLSLRKIPITGDSAFNGVTGLTIAAVGNNPEAIKEAVLAAATTSKLDPSTQWILKKTQLMQFVRIA